MTYASYEIDLRDGRFHRAKWLQQARKAKRLAREKPDDAERHTADMRKCARYAWQSHRRWMRARRVEVAGG